MTSILPEPLSSSERSVLSSALSAYSHYVEEHMADGLRKDLVLVDLECLFNKLL